MQSKDSMPLSCILLPFSFDPSPWSLLCKRRDYDQCIFSKVMIMTKDS